MNKQDRELSSGLRGNGRSAVDNMRTSTPESDLSRSYLHSSGPGGDVLPPGLNPFHLKLLEQLRDGDTEMRAQAAQSLAIEADCRAIPGLLDAVAGDDPEVRRLALLTLRNLYVNACKQQDTDLRVSLEDEQVICAIAARLRDEQSEITLAASVTLHTIPTPAAKAAITKWRKEHTGSLAAD
jgi:hypothetical protein